MAEYNLNLVEIKRIKFPKLTWSNRKFEDFEINRSTALKKCIVVGDCIYQEKPHPFLLNINLET